MEILQLRYFFESARTESFTQTAKKYRVPTTAVSSSIKRLEEELGVKLYDRTSNRIALNAKGKRFQQALCVAFGEIDKAVEDISVEYGDRREIKMLVKGMRRRITRLLNEYSLKHPNVVFKLFFSELGENEYDVIIDDDKEVYRDYERFELYSMRLQLKCSTKDPISRRTVSLSQLSDRSFVSMEPDSNMHRVLTKACGRVGFSPKISAFCNDIECYETLIAGGMGIGIGREDFVVGEEITRLDVTDFNEHYTVYVYYRKSEYYGNLKSLVDFFKTETY